MKIYEKYSLPLKSQNVNKEPALMFQKSKKAQVSDIHISVNIFNEHAFRLMYSMQDKIDKINITVLIIND